MTSCYFTVVEGPDTGRRLELKVGKTYLGRLSISNDEERGLFCWALNDMTISRTHAEISLEANSAPVLRHISSTNATLVDGRSVIRQELKPGQTILLGQTSLRME